MIGPSTDMIDSAYQGLSIVSFIDILGFSDRVINDWDNGKIVQDLFSLRSQIQQSISKLYYGIDDITIQPYVTILSDSLVIFAPVRKDATFELAFIAVRMTASKVITLSAHMGFAVRGGMEFGQAYCDGREVIGPAMVQSVRLEHAAKSARVLLGSELLTRLAANNILHIEGIARCSDGAFAVCVPSRKAGEVLLRRNASEVHVAAAESIIHDADALTLLQQNCPHEYAHKYKDWLTISGGRLRSENWSVSQLRDGARLIETLTIKKGQIST